MKAIYSLGYSLSVKFCLFFLNYIAINYMLLSEYGEFSLLHSTINSILIFSGLGLLYSSNILTSKWFLKKPYFVIEYFKLSIYLILGLSLMFSILMSFFYDNIFLIFLIIFFFSISFLLDGFFYGISEIKRLFVFGCFSLIFSIPLIYYLVVNYSLKGALIGLIFSKILLIIFQLNYFYKKILMNKNIIFRVKYLKEIILFYKKYNIPMVISGLIATPVITFCMYVLSSRKGMEEVAIFSWCYQIYLLAMFIPVALGSYYLSMFSKINLDDKKKNIDKVTRFNILISILASVVMLFFSEIILSLGGVGNYSNSLVVFYSFIVTMFFYSLNLGYVSLWSSLGKNKFQLKMQFLWALSLIITVLVLVDSFGAISMPIGMSLGFLFQFIVQRYKFKSLMV